MITPEYLNKIMDSVEGRLLDVDTYLLITIAKRIVKTFERSGEIFIPATINDLHKLMNAGVLYEDIEQELENLLPQMKKEIRQAFLDGAAEIARQNYNVAVQIVELGGLVSVKVPEWEQVGIVQSASELQMTKAEIRQLESAYKRTSGEVVNLTRTTASAAQRTYVNACDKAYMKVTHGVPVQKAVVEAIDEVSEQGIECVTYGGKQERIEVAIARAVRTGVNQANADIVLTRCAESGIGYIKTSAHLGARVTKYNDYTNHSWWQGKVYSVNWDDTALSDYAKAVEETGKGFEWLAAMREELQKQGKKYDYPDFMETCRYGDIQGICGANCRHSFYPYYPDAQTNDNDQPDIAENEKRYRQEQKQRSMERNIRKSKRKLETLKAADNGAEEFASAIKEAKKRVAAQNKAYNEYCKETGLKPRLMSLKT